MRNNYQIIALSHAFIKKINLSFYENLVKKKKYKVTCIYPDKIKSNRKVIYPDFKKYKGKIKTIKCKLKNNSSRFFYFYKIKNYIVSEKPNIVVIDNDPVSIQSLIIIYYSFFYKYKICYFSNENNVRNILIKFTVKKLIKLVLIYFINFIIRKKIYRIFCYSKQIKENYDFLGYKSKTFIMPLGFDEKIFYLPKKKKSFKKFIISYFGRIVKEKGIHVLIKSLKNFKNNNWKLLIDIDYIEDKIYFNNLISDIKQNLKKKNFSLIKANHYKIANYMRKSNIVVLPSLHEEQYGRVIQEAVACGNIVIGSNIGAIPEIIKDKDLLFRPGDYNELSKIIQALTDTKIFNKKFKYLHKTIINERTISKQVLIFDKYLGKK